jgi:hypothetical protein
MGLRFKSLNGVWVLVAAAIGFPCAAIAQPTLSTQPSGNETISETFNRAFFRNDPEFFRNRSIKRQIDLILGPGSLLRNSFPENEILRDAKLVDILYQDVLEQQASSDPIIRTPDLPNPYESTILVSPRVNVNNQTQGNELIFEQLPPR